MPAAAATLRAVEVLHGAYGSGRKWPKVLPTSFLRPAWRGAVLSTGGGSAATPRKLPLSSRCAIDCTPAPKHLGTHPPTWDATVGH